MIEFVEDLLEHSLNQEQSRECLSLISVSKEFENIADYINKFVTYKTRLFLDEQLSKDKLDQVHALYKEAHELFKLSCKALSGEKRLEQETMLSMTLEFKEKCEKLRFNLSEGNLIFSDMITCVRKIRSHSYRLYLEI